MGRGKGFDVFFTGQIGHRKIIRSDGLVGAHGGGDGGGAWGGTPGARLSGAGPFPGRGG